MKKSLLLLSSLVLLTGCQFLSSSNNSSIDTRITQTVEGERLDQEVIIPEDTSFLTMSQEEKEAAYTTLDKIALYSSDTKSPISFSMVQELSSEVAYTDFILSTQSQAKVIYLGFDECPYCKAFTPKINQLAEETETPIYYYNTRKRANDSNFETAMAMYNVETVPHAFIVKNGQVVSKINHDSSMDAIEAFFEKVKELNQ